MSLNWLQVEQYSFQSFLLLERFQIRILCGQARGAEDWQRHLGVALAYNPAVLWYFRHKCPECGSVIDSVTAQAPAGLSAETVRASELYVMAGAEDFVMYCYPALMDTHCPFIYNWDKARLFELADFTGKVVLDVGSGSGRLAFAAAEKAREVYASEPVDSLREYLRDKIRREHIPNVRVVDGMADSLPYPDDTFDIVLSGHVIGDDLEREVAEQKRVAKNGGWLLDCPGDEDRREPPNQAMLEGGWELLHYIGKAGGDVNRYRLRVVK